MPLGRWPDHDTFPIERARCPGNLLQQPSWEGTALEDATYALDRPQWCYVNEQGE